MTFTAGTFTTAQGGSVTISANGNFTYTPKHEFVGSDSFTFSAIDDGGTSAPATMSITVKNETVTASAGSLTTTENTPQTGTLKASGDSDGDVTFTAGTFTTAQGGSVTISSNGNFTYTPKPEFVGSDSFTFSAIDDGDTSAPATVSITVKDAAPSVTTPTITGTAIEGQTLTASANGGNDAVTYQWYSSVDNYQTPIGSGSTYQLQETDEGNRIKVIATVTDENGATISATSSRTASVADISPTLSVTVAGAAQEGQTLTATAVGNESDAPVTYQWQFSNNGTTWTNISGATSATYLVSEARENQFLRVTAKSADPDGSTATATSAATSAVLDAVPTVTTPTISGTAQEGRTLTASASAGQSDNPVTYQWFSSADGYHTAIGSGSTYAVSEGNEGYTIEVVATATNGNGVTISQTSLATASVLDAAPTVTKPIIAGTAQVGQTLTASASAGQTDNAVNLSVVQFRGRISHRDRLRFVLYHQRRQRRLQDRGGRDCDQRRWAAHVGDQRPDRPGNRGRGRACAYGTLIAEFAQGRNRGPGHKRGRYRLRRHCLGADCRDCRLRIPHEWTRQQQIHWRLRHLHRGRGQQRPDITLDLHRER